MDISQLAENIHEFFPAASLFSGPESLNITCDKNVAPGVCDLLFNRAHCFFMGLDWGQQADEIHVIYLFLGPGNEYIEVQTGTKKTDPVFYSVSQAVHAADWYEREAAHVLGVDFTGHPKLGDFVTHNDQPPTRVLDAEGAFIMPIGPVFSGVAESIHFRLETIGEEVIRTVPKLFYKRRNIEDLAVGRTSGDVVLLAERFAGTTAISHALGYCMAVESISGTDVPKRAVFLRVFLAEMERIRHHLGVIEGICASTGLGVAASQVAVLHEEALRITGTVTGHRYGFGMVVPGGLSLDLPDDACLTAVNQVDDIIKRLEDIERLLVKTTTFLDRLEDVGVVTKEDALEHGMVGPIARASGVCADCRRSKPYGGYDVLRPEIPCEQEGDGFARLRVFFAEIRQSTVLMRRALENAGAGPVFSRVTPKAGMKTACVESPRGLAVHRVRVDADFRVQHYRVFSPSFANWHGFHTAAEDFAFQDFPIILATFGLSVAESDR